VRLLLDADGLIKLYRAGVLLQVVGTFACSIPFTVYEEVVTRGKARLHPDAEAIESILAGEVAVWQVERHRDPEQGLGEGELGILSLLYEERDATVVSDDRRFLTALTRQGTPFLTPADMIVVLLRREKLTDGEAREALDRLRPMIRLAAYWDARQELERRGRGRDEN
jgi:hypothetical protein